MARRRRRWGWLAAGLALLALVNLAVNPWFARYRSLALMTGYDWWFERRSVPRETGVQVAMPLRDAGLYPLMITFNDDDGMSAWLGSQVDFTVEFTFADFGRWQPHSAIFEPGHPLYAAYVGSYYLQGRGRPLSAAEVALVAEFDQRRLALPALGLDFDDNHFEVLDSSARPVNFAGRDWTSHDATVSTNCPDHSPDGFQLSHLQFGTPPQTTQHFPVCELVARIEVTYLVDLDLTIGTYIIAASAAELERLSEEVVHASVVSVG